ncbi:MAG TPA: hypothetical protein VHK67_01080 [Rhabdochlamydiaceae bacterium]|jgi:hypothetical protein|nr:hypothetical protein [Rhabdochlamydiaceae bacterium]
MALRINSSVPTTVILGITSITAVMICTVLFARARGKTATAPTTPALDKGRVSPFANIPVIGRVYKLFYPTKKANSIQISIGSKDTPITSMDALNREFKAVLEKYPIPAKGRHEKPTYPEIDSVVIYGNNFDITEITDILTLNPTKLILMGARLDDTQVTELKTHGWQTHDLPSVETALKSVVLTNPATTKPYHLIYTIKA